MFFTRILTSMMILVPTAAFAETGLLFQDNTGALRRVKRVYIGKVDRVSKELTLVGNGKTRQAAQVDLDKKRQEALEQFRKEAELASGFGRADFSMRFLTYEAEILPATFSHVAEAPGVGVTITEKVTLRSSYNVLTSKSTAETEMEWTGVDLRVISGERLPVYEAVVNIGAFEIGDKGYELTIEPGQFLRNDLLLNTMYIDRKKITAELYIADSKSQEGYRVITLNGKETADFLQLQKKPGVIKRILGACAKLVGG